MVKDPVSVINAILNGKPNVDALNINGVDAMIYG